MATHLRLRENRERGTPRKAGIACKQALCLGKNSEEREGRAFPSPHPAVPKACSQAKLTVFSC